MSKLEFLATITQAETLAMDSYEKMVKTRHCDVCIHNKIDGSACLPQAECIANDGGRFVQMPLMEYLLRYCPHVYIGLQHREIQALRERLSAYEDVKAVDMERLNKALGD